MTNRSSASDRTQPIHARVDACAADCGAASITASERDLIRDSAGGILVTLGTMFAGSPVFNAHIDHATAKMLVALGKKLQRK